MKFREELPSIIPAAGLEKTLVLKTAAEIRALYQKYGFDSAGKTHSIANQQTESARPQSSGGTVNANGRTAEQEKTSRLVRTADPPLDVAVLWKLRPDKTLEPVRIRSGITDHTVTEVAELFNGSFGSWLQPTAILRNECSRDG
jgi:hypothetical protein